MWKAPMIKELYVSGYKAIKQCGIKDLAQVNIFVGKNNSGKSSLLESIYLLSSAIAPEDPLGRNKVEHLVARRSFGREIRWVERKDILWHGYRTDEPLSIAARLDSDDIKVKLYEWYQQPHALIELGEYSPQPGYDLLSIPSNVLIDSRSKGMLAFPPASVLEVVRKAFKGFENLAEYMRGSIFIDASVVHMFTMLEEKIWPRMLQKRLDRLIVRIVREGYGIDIEDLTYIPYTAQHSLAYELVAKLPTSFVRIDDLGDGARYSIYMISVASLTQNSALLIEEPENHQHPYGLYRTIDMILDLARQNNTQLFISTHSIEFIELLREANKKHRIDTAVFYLERDSEGMVTARRLTLEDIDVLRKIGIDARFLYAI